MLLNLLSKVLFILISISSINSLSLDDSGFYKIVVAIDERTAQNSVDEYVDNIKLGIQDLSNLLHHATQNKFSISEADILVPSHWDVADVQIATTQYYANADIKISHTFHLPYVNNPNPCGHPGQDIQLPYPFFDQGDSGTYGRLGGALLTQFARLRFGVWEEHGYPGDSVFPYYWKQLLGPKWEINACTDAHIEGEYRDINDGTDCTPNSEDLYPPPNQCRFIPNNEQTAKSSLMSYHYLPTIDSFCDATTHNRENPTPQNRYCKYKSVMEVIESSPDWVSTTKDNSGGIVNFNVVKNSPTPLLYILLDAGISPAPEVILTQISSKLTAFITSPELRNVVAAVGTFPTENPTSSFTEIVPWTHLGNNTEEFSKAFDTTFGRKSGFRNYAGAIHSVVQNLMERQHKQGAVILVVKTGAETNSANLTPEGLVLSSILQANLKIFAIEVQGSSIQPGIALERVTDKSSGGHLALKTLDDLQQPLDSFISTLTQTVQTDINRDSIFFISDRDIRPNMEKILVHINTQFVEFEGFGIPLIGEGVRATFTEDPDSNDYERYMEKMSDWDSATSSHIFHIAEQFYSFPAESYLWGGLDYSCTNEEEECKILLIMMAKPRDPGTIPWNVNLQVSTSALNNVVDMRSNNAASDVGTAFAIYAKLEQESIPLTYVPGMTVTAMIYGASGAWSLELKDDGKITPDVSTNDGIFSGTFIPPSDGLYNIFVTAKYRVPPEEPEPTEESVLQDNSNSSSVNPTQNVLSSSIGKLFPVDQVEIGCGSGYLGCWSQSPDTEFVVTKELSLPVEFINVNSFTALAYRITDFVVIALDNNVINLEWTEPGVQDAEGIHQADAYEIRHSESIDQLLTDFSSADILPIPNLTPGPPGNRESVSYTFVNEGDRYFAITTFVLGTPDHLDPMISNIVGVGIRSEIITTTTSTTTTTVRPTTSATTMRTTQPSTPPTTSTTEAVSTSPTVTRTTPAPSTTTRPTTSTTTTQPSTTTRKGTTEEPVKHWFQEKEGIITLAVFGAGLILLILVGLGLIYIMKYRQRTISYSRHRL